VTLAAPVAAGTPVLELQQVTKQYGNDTVVRDVDLTVARGELLALIGPSGSGKSTLMRLMVGQAIPTSGRVLLDGTSPDQAGIDQQSIVGYVPQHFMLYPSLTVQQNARFAAGIYGLGIFERRRRIRETLEHLGLWPARSRPVRNISGGMQRRLAFACALLHRPQLLFVDEATAGLDPMLRETIWNDLTGLKDEGVTVVMNTQYLDEAEKSDRVGLMTQGRLVALGTPDELRRQALGGEGIAVTAQPFTQEHSRALQALPGVIAVEQTGWTSARVVVENAQEALSRIEAALVERGAEVQSIEPYMPTFDDVFRILVREGSEHDEDAD
jgi:ABC-2 type transport system ATP-binding protein